MEMGGLAFTHPFASKTEHYTTDRLEPWFENYKDVNNYKAHWYKLTFFNNNVIIIIT